MTAPQQADFIFLPLLDGTHGVGQVISRVTPDAPILIGLTLRHAIAGDPVSALHLSDFIALLQTTPDLINSGAWVLGGFEQLPDFTETLVGYPSEDAQTVHDPAVVEAFLNACHGLYPWDSFGDLFARMARPDLPEGTVPQKS